MVIELLTFGVLFSLRNIILYAAPECLVKQLFSMFTTDILNVTIGNA